MKILTAGLLLTLSAGPALAIDDYVSFEVPEADIEQVYSSAYKDCIAASGGVTVTMQDCIAGEYDRLELRLEAALTEAIDRSSYAALALRQTAWRAKGNKVCLQQGAEAGGGSASDLVIRSCTLRELIRRLIWLDRL